MLGSCIRLTLGSYVIKPCKWNQKITKEFRLEITSGIPFINRLKVTSESYVRLVLGSYGNKKIRSHDVMTT